MTPKFTIVIESFTTSEGGSQERFRKVVSKAVAVAAEGSGEVVITDVFGDAALGAMLAEEFPSVRRMDARAEPYDRAKMLAAREARGQYVLYLDGDCVPSEGWAGHLIRALDEDANIVAAGGWTRYDGGFFSALMSVMDFGFFYPLERKPLKCYASNNSAFRREELVERPIPCVNTRCACFYHAQMLWRRGVPVMLIPEAIVLHEAQPVVRERTRQGYDAVAACFDDPGLPEAKWLRLGVLSVPLFYTMKIWLDWRRAISGRDPLCFTILSLPLALALFPLLRMLDAIGMFRAILQGKREGGWGGWELFQPEES